jgi:phage recombination protein Bet
MKASSQSLIVKMAAKYGVDSGQFYNTVVTTIFSAGKAKQGEEPKPGRGLPPTKEMVMAFLLVADQYDLNPFLREIYPFIDQNFNLRCIISIDGWIKVALRHEFYDGHEFKEHLDPDTKALYAVTCSIFRKDRTRPIIMTEYMQECKRDTDPWKQWPYRMLHHKAFIQTARYALGMGDLMEEDELDRLKSVTGGEHEIVQPRRMSESGPKELQPAQPSNIPTSTAPAREPVATAAPRQAQAAPRSAAAAPEPGSEEASEFLNTAELNELFRVGYNNSWSLMDMKKSLKEKMNIVDTNKVPRSSALAIKEMFEGGS